MTRVIGVRFRRAGKVYFFAPGKYKIRTGDKVIVETARGVEFGSVVTGPKEVEDDKILQPLKPVIRIATADDIRREEKNREKEKEAFGICLEKIRKHGLEMKLIDAEYTFDNNKVLFYFTADGRIDFRELVKTWQVCSAGSSFGRSACGMKRRSAGHWYLRKELCCHTYLSEFAPVSIKMAKEQNLSLNPSKISGVCGRLMCCLPMKSRPTKELNRHLPANGDHVTTPEGLKGDMQAVNVLRQQVKVVVTLDNDEKRSGSTRPQSLSSSPDERKRDVKLSKEEMLAELRNLEEKNGASKLDDE